VFDPRHRRGRRHDSATIVLLAVAATLAGARSFAAIGEWVADAPMTVPARLGVIWPPTSPPGCDITPATSTSPSNSC
jgi:hypothetical protein